MRHPAIPGAGAVRRNIVETLFFRGLTTPLALALVVVQSRFLHPGGRGTFVLAILSVTLFARLLGQLGVAVTHRMSEESVDVRALVDRALAAGTALSIAGAAAIVAWGWGSGELTGDIAVLAGVALVPAVIWQTICGVLLGLARLRLWNVVQLVPPVFSLVGMVVLFALTGASVRKAVAVWTFAHVATAFVALVSARDTWRPLRRIRLWDGEGRRIVRLGVTMGAAQVLNLVSYRIELFVLLYATTVAQAGVYSIAVQTGESAWLVSGAIANAITASVVRETPERAAALVVRSAVKVFVFTGALAVAVGAAAPFVIPRALGHSFSHAAVALVFLLPGIVVYAPVSVLTVYLSARCGRPRLSLAASATGLVATGIAAGVLIPRWGASGAAAASSVGYAAGALVAWAAFDRLRRLSSG